MVAQLYETCLRCGQGRLKPWRDLDDDERIVVRRLPAFANYSAGEREAMHRWCTQCWFEETERASHDA